MGGFVQGSLGLSSRDDFWSDEEKPICCAIFITGPESRRYQSEIMVLFAGGLNSINLCGGSLLRATQKWSDRSDMRIAYSLLQVLLGFTVFFFLFIFQLYLLN